MKKVYTFFLLINLLYSEEYMHIIDNSISESDLFIKRVSANKYIFPISRNEAKFIGNYLYDENFNKVKEFQEQNNITLKLEKGKIYYNVYEFENNPGIETYIRLYVSNNPFIRQYCITEGEVSKKSYLSGSFYTDFKIKSGNLEFYNRIPYKLGKKIFLIFRFETK